jgi:hypothetical protein
LVFGVPQRLTITSIFLDDHPLALNNPVDGRLVVPVLEMGTESILTISWEVTGETSDLIGMASENLIWPPQIRVKKNLITFLPESPTRLWNRTGLIAMSSLDQNLDRLDTLLERHAGLDNDIKAATANRWLIHQLQSRLVARLPAEVERPTEAVRERLNRWERITEEINQLEPVPPAPPLSWQMRLLEGPVTDSDAALRGRTDRPAQFQFWQFNEHLLMYAMSLIVAVILIPICRRLIRLEWSGWLHQHVGISWLMLALFWWLFLTPSAFGPVLLILGLIRALLHSRPVQFASDSQASTA